MRVLLDQLIGIEAVGACRTLGRELLLQIADLLNGPRQLRQRIELGLVQTVVLKRGQCFDLPVEHSHDLFGQTQLPALLSEFSAGQPVLLEGPLELLFILSEERCDLGGRDAIVTAERNGAAATHRKR